MIDGPLAREALRLPLELLVAVCGGLGLAIVILAPVIVWRMV